MMFTHRKEFGTHTQSIHYGSGPAQLLEMQLRALREEPERDHVFTLAKGGRLKNVYVTPENRERHLARLEKELARMQKRR